ncbi:hypothetical protein RHMOL_Rhmol09G0027500 [Rhododendron molle]|uniref:Uncharacterized protein n=1 Tax=Rhododendron molle TaxID=49168 RepID=A0ACC0MAZ6_RHOML|nr:hypothetical protein RHMOL_Rhmol09G0027500 [Rhododendron molle]
MQRATEREADAAKHAFLSNTRNPGLAIQEVEEKIWDTAQEESTGVLRKAESEYKGHRTLLSRTQNLLSTTQRQDVLDRQVSKSCVLSEQGDTTVGFLLFSCAVTAAIKAGMAGKKDVGLGPAVDVINLGQGNVDPMMAISLEPTCLMNCEVLEDLHDSIYKLQRQETKFPFVSSETSKIFLF